MRRLVLAGVMALLVSGSTAGARPASITYSQFLETLGTGQRGYVLANRGSTPIRIVAIRGKDFDITGVVTAWTTSGPRPVCSVSDQPATVRCDRFELAKNAALTLRLSTARAGQAAEAAITDGAEPTATSFFPLNAQRPQAHGVIRAKRLSATRVQIKGINTGFRMWTRLRFQPPKSAGLSRTLSFKVARFGPLGYGARPKPACEILFDTKPRGSTRPDAGPQAVCTPDVAAGEEFLWVLLMHVATPKGHIWISTPDGKLTLVDI